MKDLAVGEAIGKVWEKGRKFLVEACDRDFGRYGGRSLWRLAWPPMGILPKQLHFEECAIASGMTVRVRNG